MKIFLVSIVVLLSACQYTGRNDPYVYWEPTAASPMNETREWCDVMDAATAKFRRLGEPGDCE